MKYRKKLLMLIHVIDEQLARASKLLSVQHSNIIKEEHQNVFVKDELMMFMTRYHKSYIISEDVKMIHQYLLQEMRELMLYYLWLMLLFQQRLKTTVWKTNAISTYMWSIDLNEKKWTSKRMCKMMKCESLIELRVKMMIASYRELTIEISRRYMQERKFQMNENDADDDWQKNEQNEMLNLQTKHTTHVVEMIYAREIMKQSDEIVSKRQKFQEFSEMWHRFLTFEFIMRSKSDQEEKRKIELFESEAKESRMHQWKRLRSIKLDDELKRLMNVDSRFREMQKSTIEIIMTRKSSMMIVMIIKEEKSLLFMLSTWCSQSDISIVVMSLIALRQNMKQRCKRMNITCVEWNSRWSLDAIKIVLVTSKFAMSDEFQTFINWLRVTQILNRIVIDECHVMLNEQHNFRRQMQQLRDLMNVKMQMILLTTTLSLSKEKELW